MKDKYIHTQVDEQWANCRNTSREVASAIHAVAGPNDMDRVWEAPTDKEFDEVVKALEQFIGDGDVAWDHTFHWGEVSITPVVHTFKDYPNAQAYHDFMGGWLLLVDQGYWVWDDPATIQDLRGEEWMDECVRQQCWDETLLKEAA